jgi:hypothetical protein
MQQFITRSKTVSRKSLYLLAGLCITGLMACAGNGNNNGGDKRTDSNPVAPIAAGDTSLKLPAGFSAVTVVENFGKTRHLAVAPNGAVYVKLDR